MPHVIVKLYPGKSEEVKKRISDAITQAIMEAAGSRDAGISVAIEEVEPADWAEQVYKPDILGQPGRIYKAPGYTLEDLKR